MQFLSENCPTLNGCQLFEWFGFLRTESEPNVCFPHIPSKWKQITKLRRLTNNIHTSIDARHEPTALFTRTICIGNALRNAFNAFSKLPTNAFHLKPRTETYILSHKNKKYNKMTSMQWHQLQSFQYRDEFLTGTHNVAVLWVAAERGGRSLPYGCHNFCD